MPALTVACVLRSGGDFDSRWVVVLQRGVAEHLPLPHRFVCLTDMDVPGIECVPLERGWPGWWSKLELFRGDYAEGPALYMDIDTLPTGDLSEIASYGGEFAMLSDFYRPDVAQSGVMALSPGKHIERLWDAFTTDPAGHMKRFRGDGEWLHLNARPDRLQCLYPGQIVSTKVGAANGVPEGARLCCAHGKPRFTERRAGWTHELWTRRAA